MVDKDKDINLDPAEVKKVARSYKEIGEALKESHDLSAKLSKMMGEAKKSSDGYKKSMEDAASTTNHIAKVQFEMGRNSDLIKSVQEKMKAETQMAANARERLALTSENLSKQQQELRMKQEILGYQEQMGMFTSDGVSMLQEEIEALQKQISQSEILMTRDQARLKFTNKTLEGLAEEESRRKLIGDALDRKLKSDQAALLVLEKQADEYKKMGEAIRKGMGVETLKETDRFLSRQSEQYAKIRDFISSMGNPLSAILAMIQASVERWIELDRAAESFRRTTGLIRGQSERIESIARRTNIEYAKYGVTLEAAYESAKFLTKELGVSSLVSSEMVKSSALYAANLGISAEHTAGIYGRFTSLARASGTTADNVILAGSALAHMAGVPISRVMGDVANASSEALMFLGKAPLQMMKAAIEARKMGTTLDSMAKSARGLLNFQDSINSEMEASALLGKNVNFQYARQLAFEGDIEGSRKAALRQIAAMGNFSKLNVYQQEALAKAAGMTVDEIVKQQNQEKMLRALKKNDPAAYAKMMDYEKAKVASNKETEASLVAQGRAMANQQMMQAKMTQMTNALSEAWLSIQEALMPIADVIMPIFIGGVKVLAGIITFLGKSVKYVTDSLIGAKDATEGITEAAKPVCGVFEAIKDYASEVMKAMDDNPWIKWTIGGATLTLGVIGLVRVIKTIPSALSGTKSLFSKMFDSVGKGIKSVANSVGGSIKSLFKNVAQGVGYFGKSEVLKGAASMALISLSMLGLAASLKIFNGVEWASLAKGGVALAGLMGTMFVLSKMSADVLIGAAALGVLGLSMMGIAYSMKMFNDVKWESLGKAAVALVGFSAAAFALGAIMMSGVGAAAFIAGAAAIAGLGVAMGVFGVGAKLFASGAEDLAKAMVSIIVPINELGKVAPNLLLAAAGIAAIGVSLAAFGTGSAAAGVGTFVGKLFGGDMFSKLKELANISGGLNSVADSLASIQKSLKSFGDIDIGKLKSVIQQANEIKSINVGAPVRFNVVPTSGAQDELAELKQTMSGDAKAPDSTAKTKSESSQVDNSDVVARLDTLIDLIKSGALSVDLDGKKVSSALSAYGRS